MRLRRVPLSLGLLLFDRKGFLERHFEALVLPLFFLLELPPEVSVLGVLEADFFARRVEFRQLFFRFRVRLLGLFRVSLAVKVRGSGLPGNRPSLLFEIFRGIDHESFISFETLRVLFLVLLPGVSQQPGEILRNHEGSETLGELLEVLGVD